MTTPSFPERFARTILKHRWLVLAGSLLVFLLIAAGARKIYIRTDYRIFFSKENPQLTAYEELQNVYTKDDNIFVVLNHPEREVFSSDYLQAIQWLTDRAWRMTNHVTRVDSLTNFQHSEAEGDDILVGDLVEDPSTITPEELAKVESVARNEPMIAHRLIGDNPHVVGMNIILTLPEERHDEPVTAAQEARAVMQEFKAEFPGYETYLTGMVMLNNSFAETSQRDMGTIVPIMYGGIIVIMTLLLRSFSGTFATFGVIMASSAVGMGFMGHVGIPLTPPVATAPIIITTLAVADSIHILVSLLHAMKMGRSKHEAIVESIRINFQPVFLTSLTTAIGFLSLNFSDAPPFRDLGNIVAVGVVGAWFFSVFTLPAFLSLMPMKVGQQREGTTNGFDRLSDFIIRKRAACLWGSAAVVVLLAAFIPKIVLDDRWVDYFAEGLSFRDDTDYTVDNLTGIYTIEYSMKSGESNGIADPDYLASLDRFAQWLRSQDEVLQVVTLSDIMKRLNRNMHADDASYYRTPEARDLAAQYLLLFEMSLPYGLDLNNMINVDKSATRMTVALGDISTKQLREMIGRIGDWQKANLPEVMQTEPTSPSVMFAWISKRNIESMLTGTALAAVLISLIIGIALKSTRYGLASLVPNFIPAIMGFGAWGMLVGSIGMSLAVVTGMTLGIVVDDTVHFMSKYLRARREHGYTAEEAIRFAFQSVGKALVVTTVILTVGFAILSFSPFRLNSWMGQLTAIVIVFALLADFFLLPALLLTMDRKKAVAAHGKSPTITPEEELSHVS